MPTSTGGAVAHITSTMAQAQFMAVVVCTGPGFLHYIWLAGLMCVAAMEDEFQSGQPLPEADVKLGMGPIPGQYNPEDSPIGLSVARAVRYGDEWRLFLDNELIVLEPAPSPQELEDLKNKLDQIDVDSATENPRNKLRDAWFAFVGPHVQEETWDELFGYVARWKVGWQPDSPVRDDGHDFVNTPLVIRYSRLLERLGNEKQRWRESSEFGPEPPAIGMFDHERDVQQRPVTDDMVTRFTKMLDGETEQSEDELSEDDDDMDLSGDGLPDPNLVFSNASADYLWGMYSGSDLNVFTAPTPKKNPPPANLNQNSVHKYAKAPGTPVYRAPRNVQLF